eukprot:scaffold15460_cov93-Isochrysis_galbana.AAC.1
MCATPDPPCFRHLLPAVSCVPRARAYGPRPSAPAVPAPSQILFNSALTNLNVPVLVFVGGYFSVRQTNRLASHLPAVCALGRSIRPRACASVYVCAPNPRRRFHPPADWVQRRPHQPERPGARVRRRILRRAPHTPCCLPCVRSAIRPAPPTRPPHMPVTVRPSAVPLPQITSNALTILSFPGLASVGEDVFVRHTHPPASHTCCLPCVRSA